MFTGLHGWTAHAEEGNEAVMLRVMDKGPIAEEDGGKEAQLSMARHAHVSRQGSLVDGKNTRSSVKEGEEVSAAVGDPGSIYAGGCEGTRSSKVTTH
ncbi:hypothetical protein DACRYDRAFT_103207 [Dacryopinax primogenitus]|uniref:Uncharacterized protein n=1 Tax=Dacryopinax primogenitus (strain DJM 731) TaxID=1858805 RepID=M5GGX8_DACPD|nr:uncharacterized protein DACRYDRAFT_103207 [Dacryopinax primogenitus]EJU06263.1 hypothetical protein DACRYDRAFT_103207 [Dacryopinax primogenitus]